MMSPTQTTCRWPMKNRGRKWNSRCAWVTKDPEYIEYHDEAVAGRCMTPASCLPSSASMANRRGCRGSPSPQSAPSYHRAYAVLIRCASCPQGRPGRGAADGTPGHHPPTGSKVQSIIKTPAPIWRWNGRHRLRRLSVGLRGRRPIVNQRRGQRRRFRRPRRVGCHVKTPQKRPFVGNTIYMPSLQAVGHWWTVICGDTALHRRGVPASSSDVKNARRGARSLPFFC